jgi:N-acetylneuraminate synthase
MKIRLTPHKEVFNGCEPYVIAEIGANHNGDMELARRMIDSAKACGADAAKFQSWTPESLIAREEYERNQKYNDSPKKHFGSLREMVEKYYLREDQHRKLKAYCEEIGIDFCSTPFSHDEADLINNMGVSYHKIASMDINNLELLRHVARFQKPILLSTGMATLAEIETALHTIEGEGNREIVLLHCISIYPPAYEDIHLRNITMLQQAFGYPVGFSDHTIGISIPLATVALGCCLIEKHFTLDKGLPGWDHEISADPDEMVVISRESRNIARAMGNFQRLVSPAEEEKKLKFRRSLVLKRRIERGEVIRGEDLTCKRPGTGIAPDEKRYVVGRSLARALDADELVRWEDLV